MRDHRPPSWNGLFAFFKLGSLVLLIIGLSACKRIPPHPVITEAYIRPDPIVGEIVTLHIEVMSGEDEDDVTIGALLPDEINLVAGELEWHGSLKANQSQAHEMSICVLQPGDNWRIFLGVSETSSMGDGDILHIESTTDSAHVIPSKDYRVVGPGNLVTAFWEVDNVTPTPIPPTVSAECSAVRASSPTPTVQLPNATSTPTVTPTRPFPTFTPEPTRRLTSAPDAIDPSLPPPTGQIFMIWDPDPPEYIDGKLKGSFNYNLYRLFPSATPTLDIIDVAPAHLFNAPYVLNVSPDQKKIALILLDDTNGNGQFDSHGYDTDNQTIHLYHVANNTLVPFAAGEHSIFSVSWLPDSQALLYPQGEDVLLSKLDGSPTEVFLNISGAHINQVSLSPDGEWLVLYGGNPAPQIFAFQLGTNNIIMADNTQFRDMKRPQWSADGSLLAFGQHGFHPLSLFNTETVEFTVSLAPDEDIVRMPSWSLDGQWLAIPANLTKLSLWNRDTLDVTEILTSTFVSPPIWSPKDNQLVVGLIKDNTGKLLAIDVTTGEIQEWHIGNNIRGIRVLSWSPDGNWVAFIAVGADDSGLYLAAKQAEKVYLVLDLMGGDAVGEFVWLPNF